MPVIRRTNEQDETPSEPAVEDGAPVFDADGVDQYGRTRRWYELFGATTDVTPDED